MSEDPDSFFVVKGSLVDKWAFRELPSITRGDVTRELDLIVDRGAPTVANRTLAALRKMLNWSVSRDYLPTNPCAGIRAPVAEKPRDRILTDDEVRAFWNACDQLGSPFGPLFQILLLTGQRREEVAAMTWSEIEGDVWTIPRERAKNDKAHAVPLSSAASSILSGIESIAGTQGYVFTTTGTSPVSGFSRAKKKKLDGLMLESLLEEAAAQDKEAKLLPWRTHDLRRTVASGMARLGINLPVIERVLNHVSGSFGGIVSVHQKHEFQDEKRLALETWNRFVGSVATPTVNVIDIHNRAKV
tara:strand:- start:1161 stop:2063 length:903 start_codon:yes stop_codon:yes gene_type:complete